MFVDVCVTHWGFDSPPSVTRLPRVMEMMLQQEQLQGLALDDVNSESDEDVTQLGEMMSHAWKIIGKTRV